MKRFTNALFAAALLAGGATMAATPALAKDKKDDAKASGAPSLKLGKEVQVPAAAAQKALAANDYATAEPLVAQAEAAAKTDDERYIAAALRLNVEAQKIGKGQGSDAALAVPLKALIANPKTPQADQARYNYELGRIAYNAKDFANANTYLTQAKNLGYNDPNLALLLVNVKAGSGDVASASADMEAAINAQIAAGQKPSEDLYRFMVAKANQKKDQALTYKWLTRYVEAYPTAKVWHDVVGTMGLGQGAMLTLDKAQKLDLYRLLRAGKILMADQFDYELYAQYAIDLGIPWEAKAVLTEGKASGKIPASSADANSLLAAANKSISNEGSLDALATKARTGTAKLAAGTADAFLSEGKYPTAIELYRIALQKGGVDADAVNTHLGIALAMSGDKEGARTAFQQVKTSPRAQIAGLWIEFLDHPPVA